MANRITDKALNNSAKRIDDNSDAISKEDIIAMIEENNINIFDLSDFFIRDAVRLE